MFIVQRLIWCLLVCVVVTVGCCADTARPIGNDDMSAVGQASLAQLDAAIAAADSVALARHRAIVAWFADPANGRVVAQLRLLYKEFATVEPAVLTVLLAADRYEPTEVEYSLLVLAVPGLKKLKKFPLVNTVEHAWAWFVRLYWLFFLGTAVWDMGVYGAYSLLTPSGEKVRGAGIDPSLHEEYDEYHGSYYMPFDIRMIWWKYGPHNTLFRGFLALLSACFAAHSFKQEVAGYRNRYKESKAQWEVLAQAVYGLSLMKQIYSITAGNSPLYEAAECAQVPDFFQKQVVEDDEATELWQALTSVAFDPVLGGHWWSGHSERVWQLLSSKVVAVSGVVRAIGYVEAYMHRAGAESGN